jgi:hypothetical protein
MCRDVTSAEPANAVQTTTHPAVEAVQDLADEYEKALER